MVRYANLAGHMQEFRRDMQLANLSPKTIEKRIELVERFRRFLGDKPLLDAETEDARHFQQTWSALAPASVDIYTRHLQAFFQWAVKRGFIVVDPTVDLIRPRVTKGRPHPVFADDLRVILATAPRSIRMAFALAAFAGLRRGEICAMERRDLELSTPVPTALIHGKGRKERVVPLLAALVSEIYDYGLPRAGYVLLRRGKPYDPERLTIDVWRVMKDLGVETTLHSARHSFATYAAKMTRDPLFVRDLLGHESVSTTEIYVQTSMNDAHLRLAELGTLAGDMLTGNRPRLAVVREVNG